MQAKFAGFFHMMALATVLPTIGKAEVLDEQLIPAGELQVTKEGFGPAVLSLGDRVLMEDSSIALQTVGDMGVLVKTHHGGKFCPETYFVIDPATGAFRETGGGEDSPYVLGQCRNLVEVVPSLNMLVFGPDAFDEQASVVTWDGYAFTNTVIQQRPHAAAGSGQEVERWHAQWTSAFLADPSERARLEAAIPAEDLNWILAEMRSGDEMTVHNGFLTGTACSSYECGSIWAKLAVRVSDGSVFYWLHNQPEADIHPELPDFFR